MKARFVIPFCAASALSFGAFGANMDARLAKNDAVCGGYEVFHINGVLTTLAEATDNLNALRTAYGNSYKEHLIQYHLAYNQTRDPGGDLIDCYNQVLRAYPGTTMEEFYRSVMLGIGSNILTANIVSMLAGKWAALFNMDRPAAYTDQDVINIANAIFGNHRKDGRVLLIPHSQGNFYANIIYPQLITGGQYGSNWAIAAKAIQTLGLATPADRIEGAGARITNTNDKVINSVRLIFPKTLAGNITIPVIDMLGHNLIGVYLKSGYPGRNAVINGMTTRMDGLKSTALANVSWLRGQAGFTRCGPAPWPYGTGVEPVTEIQCPITKWQPVYPNWYFWGYTDQDYVEYTPYDPTVGKTVPNEFIIGATASQAAPLAKAFVEGCYKTFVADRKSQLLLNIPPNPYDSRAKLLGSCGYGFPAMEPNGYSAAAWNIYSGDVAPLVFPLFSPDVKMDTYRTDLKPLCKW